MAKNKFIETPRSKPSQNICETVAQTFHEENDSEDEYFASSITLLSKPSTDDVINKLEELQDKIHSMSTIYNILSEFRPTINLLYHNRSAPNTSKHKSTTTNDCETKQQLNVESEKPLDTKEDNNIQTLSKYIDSMKQCIIQLSEEVTQVVNSQNYLNTKLTNICGEPCKPTQEQYQVYNTSLTHDKNSAIQPEHVITKDQSITKFSKTKVEKNYTKPNSKEELKNSAKLQSIESSKVVSNEPRKKKPTISKDNTKGKVIKPGKTSQQIKTNSSFQETPLIEHSLVEKNTSTTDLEENNSNILVENVVREESRLYFNGDCLFPNLNMVFKNLKTTNENSNSVNGNSPYGVRDDIYYCGSTKSSANNCMNGLKNLNATNKEIEKIKGTRLESNPTKCADLCKSLKTETFPAINMGSKKTNLIENQYNINIKNSKLEQAKGLSFMEKCDIACNTNKNTSEFNGYQLVNEMVSEKSQNTGHHNELSLQYCHGNSSSYTVVTDNKNKLNDYQNSFEQNMTLTKCFNKGNITGETDEKHTALNENKKASCNQNGICKFLQSQPVPAWVVQTKLSPNSKDSSNKAHEKTAAFSCNNVCQILPSSERSNNTEYLNKTNVLHTNIEYKQGKSFNSPCRKNKNEDLHKCDVNNQGINTKCPNNSQNNYKKDDDNPVGNLNSPCKKNHICQFLQSQPPPEWTKSTCTNVIKNVNKKDDKTGEFLNCSNNKNGICQFLQSQPVPEWTKSTKCPNEIKQLEKKDDHKPSESLNFTCKKNHICQFLKSQPVPDWTKSTSNQNKNEDLQKCDDKNQENISTYPNNNQDILKKDDHTQDKSFNYTCKKNDICHLLQSQPIPEWTKSIGTNEIKALNKNYADKPGESLNCFNKKHEICGSVQSESIYKTSHIEKQYNQPTCLANIKTQMTYSPNENVQSKHVTSTGVNSTNINENHQTGSQTCPCGKCKALYVKPTTDSQNEKLTHSKPPFNKALEDDILQRLNRNPCNKKCVILVSGSDSLLNKISTPVISKQDKNTLEDEHNTTTRKCQFSQQDVTPCPKDAFKSEQDSPCTKILSPCGNCNNKKTTNCETEQVKENENVAESSKLTKKCPCSSQNNDSSDPPNNGIYSNDARILSPCGTSNRKNATNCEPDRVKENENVAEESSKPTKICPCFSQRNDSCDPTNNGKDPFNTKILSPCGKCTAKPETSNKESSCQQTKQPKNVTPHVGLSSCDSTVARSKPDKTQQNNVEEDNSVGLVKKCPCAHKNLVDPKENSEALSPCAFNSTNSQTENQPRSQTQCNSKCPKS